MFVPTEKELRRQIRRMQKGATTVDRFPPLSAASTVARSHSYPPYPRALRLPVFSSDLAMFCDIVWSHRNNALSSPRPQDYIYRLYSRQFRKGLSNDDITLEEVRTFLTGLRELAGMHGGCWVQSSGMVTLVDLLEMCAPDASPDRYTFAGQRFIHFFSRSAATFGRITHRIYLNVVPACRLEVMRWVCQEILHFSPYKSPSAKVSGPAVNRSDSIVIYLAGDSTLHIVLNAIALYQQYHRDFFGDETPRLTNCITTLDMEGDIMPLRGVATGMEPPRAEWPTDLELRKKAALYLLPSGNVSFGSYRSDIFTYALLKVWKEEMDEVLPIPSNFKFRFLFYFVEGCKLVGLDPAHIDLQDRLADLELIADSAAKYRG